VRSNPAGVYIRRVLVFYKEKKNICIVEVPAYKDVCVYVGKQSLLFYYEREFKTGRNRHVTKTRHFKFYMEGENCKS
jgi:hypothetical protein